LAKRRAAADCGTARQDIQAAQHILHPGQQALGDPASYCRPAVLDQDGGNAEARRRGIGEAGDRGVGAALDQQAGEPKA
jgi:hypothetical protein